MQRKIEKIKNILAFLSIIFNDNEDCLKEVMKIRPEYLIEKFERYVLSNRSESDWGLHPYLRRIFFDRYCEKYNLPIFNYEE